MTVPALVLQIVVAVLLYAVLLLITRAVDREDLSWFRDLAPIRGHS